MSYDTGNPVPSTDVRDLSDNSENFDLAINSPLFTFQDRLNQLRYTLAGYQNLATGVPAVEASIIAEQARDAALAARDAAQLSSGVYATTAEGLAATASGRYFSVPTGEAGVYLTLYRNNAGTAVAIAQYPSATAVNDLLSMIRGFTDGSAAFEFRDAGSFILASIDALGVFSAKELESSGLRTVQNDSAKVEVTDRFGFLLDTLPTPPALLQGRQLRADYMAIEDYGQSLSRGVLSMPILSTTQPYQNVMVSSGPKLRLTDIGYGPGSFLPYIETLTLENGTTGSEEGESPMAGTTNGLVRRIVADGGAAADWKFVGSSSGRGARRIEEFFPGASNRDYNSLLQKVRDTKALCDSLGKTYNFWALCWTQGENNYIEGVQTPFEYEALELQLFDLLAADICAITGQNFRPYFFSYQVGTHRKAGRDDMPIALAHWRASKMHDHVVLAAPAYMFPTVTSDYTHLTNEASWLYGQYRARAIYHTMFKRSGKWRPLEPVSVDWQPTYVDVKFNVPCGPLVLDTALCAAQVNQGFDIREAGAVVTDLITSVNVTAFDTVRLALSRPAAATGVLTYARGRIGDPARSGPSSGARGNLRDSHGAVDSATSPSGAVYAMHNACVMFEYSRISGF